MPLNVLIIVPPLRKKNSFYPPFGALCVLAAAKEAGYNVNLLDLDVNRCSYKETIDKIASFVPDVIGISAVVATSYKYVKEITPLIKKRLSKKATIIVGGGLSALEDVLLNNSEVDFLVHGEGEITFKELLNSIEKEKDYSLVKGISFKRDNKILKTQARELIPDLDILPFPNYDLLELSKYILDIREFVTSNYGGNLETIDKRVSDPQRNHRFFRVVISRGCTTECTFCYRNMEGLRVHSLKYIGDLIEYVIRKYKIGHISFADECFGGTKKWVRTFIEMLKKRKFDITFHITGMRVTTVDEEILKELKGLGVWHIQYGFESGSQKILRIMEKNTSQKLNIRVAQLTRKVGINTIPFIIIGYPGETVETIYETIDFLKNANLLSKNFRPNFPLALPGTPLYEYAQLKGYITDEDKYMESISDVEASDLSGDNYFINYTGESTKTVMSWMTLMGNEVDKHYHVDIRIISKMKSLIRIIIAEGFIKTVAFLMKRLYMEFYAFKEKKKYTQSFKDTLFSAKEAKDLIKEKDVNEEINPQGESLRKINKRLREKVDNGNYARKIREVC